MYCPPPQNDHNIPRTFEINGALKPIGPIGSNHYGIDIKEVREKLKFHLMNERNVDFNLHPGSLRSIAPMGARR